MAHLPSVFFSGIITGVAISVGALFFLLSNKGLDSQPSRQSPPTNNENERENKRKTASEYNGEDTQQLVETISLYSEQEKTIVREAISSLRTIKVRLEKEEIVKYFDDQKNLSFEALDRNFSELIKVGKDREKHMRNITSYFHDLSKVYSGTSKDLTKLLSQINHSAMKTDADEVWDRWWPALSNVTQKLSIDNESLAEVILKDIVAAFSKLCDDHSQVIRHYATEGNHLTQLIKEHQANVDSKAKDRDRCRERFDSAIEKTSAPNASAAKAASQADLHANTRLLQKLEGAEQALVEATEKLELLQVDFMSKMPKLITDIYVFGFKMTQDCKVQIIKFVNMLQHMHGSNSVIAQALRTDVLSAFAPPESAFVDLMGFESGLVRTLNALNESISATSSSTQESSAATSAAAGTAAGEMKSPEKKPGDGSAGSETKESPDTSASQPKSATQTKLNMYAESSAILASCSPLLLPQLPASFASAVGVESCVWFNVLIGRIYRDMQRSPYFNYWFLAKSYSGFNKGARPDYVDEFVLEDVKWGSLAPVLMNIHWIPATATATATTAATAAPAAASTSSDTNTSGPTSGTNTTSSSTPSSSSAASEPSPPRTAFDHHWTADITFRSGLKITISTKLWINWPRDKYASIPVTLSVELDELTGKLIVGLDEGSLWLSFLEEPFTRIKVITQVGEQFKLKDIPQLSAFMTKKMKSIIRSKLVYPQKHHIRLPWPRYWWSDDVQSKFMPTVIPTHLTKFHQLHPRVQNMIHTMNKVNFTQFENEIKMNPDWAKYVVEHQYQVTAYEVPSTMLHASSADSDDGESGSAMPGRSTKSQSQKSAVSGSGAAMGTGSGASTNLKAAAASSHPARDTAKKHLATVKETVKSKVSSWFKKIEKVGSKVTHKAEDALDSMDIAIEKKWTSVVENLKAKRKTFVEKLKSDKRRHGGAPSSLTKPLRRSRSQNSISQGTKVSFRASYGGKMSVDDSSASMPRNSRSVSWAGDFAVLPSAALSGVPNGPVGNIGSTQLSYLVYHKDDQLSSTPTHAHGSNSSVHGGRKRAWSLSDYRSEHLEAIAVQILYANAEQELREEQHSLTIPSTLLDSHSRDHSKSSTPAASQHPSSQQKFSASASATAGSQFETHQNSSTTSDSNAAPIKHNLEWISKVAKDKYQKLKSSTVETYLLGTEHQQQSGVGSKSAEHHGSDGGKKESFLDMGRRFLESNTASHKQHNQPPPQQQQQSKQQQKQQQQQRTPTVSPDKPVRVQQPSAASTVIHSELATTKSLPPAVQPVSVVKEVTPHKFHEVSVPSFADPIASTPTPVLAPTTHQASVVQVVPEGISSSISATTTSTSTAAIASSVAPTPVTTSAAIPPVKPAKPAANPIPPPALQSTASERSLMSRQFSKPADDPLAEPTSVTTKSVVAEVADLLNLDPDSPVTSTPRAIASPSVNSSSLLDLDNPPSPLFSPNSDHSPIPLAASATMSNLSAPIANPNSLSPLENESSSAKTPAGRLLNEDMEPLVPSPRSGLSRQLSKAGDSSKAPSPVASPRESNLFRDNSATISSLLDSPDPMQSHDPVRTEAYTGGASAGAVELATKGSVASAGNVVDDLIDFSLDDEDTPVPSSAQLPTANFHDPNTSIHAKSPENIQTAANATRKPATTTAVPPPASNPADLMAKYKTKEKASTGLMKAFEKARSKFGGTEM